MASDRTPRDRDDDALSWGDEDPTLDTGVSARDEASHVDAAPRAEPLPGGYTAVGRGTKDGAPVPAETTPTAVDTADVTAEDAAAPASMSSPALLALGVIGGVYLLFAIGWLIGGSRLQGVAGFLVDPSGVAPPLWTGGNLVALWLAVLAPVIWFGTVYRLTRSSRAWVRWALLALGVILLVPWPFVMVGAAGS
ncbi:hypothetical protein CVS47_01719 [Microbacterium lemovicicum]|uniref:DNA polymerase III subunit gamma/tau n=1 Tax=Microbacterium lemovicicum TaxID=1072463 RepID=A0A3S9WAI8_9MICO|nr:DNA polymerase III subunit gamma/tau [Microbacterium lemovicicum]AZS37092.1 hypothetical protein CVS47_01719 [Microbacterium lemovicicum]